MKKTNKKHVNKYQTIITKDELIKRLFRGGILNNNDASIVGTYTTIKDYGRGEIRCYIFEKIIQFYYTHIVRSDNGKGGIISRKKSRIDFKLTNNDLKKFMPIPCTSI